MASSNIYKITDGEIGGHVTRIGKIKNAYTILKGKSEAERPHVPLIRTHL
jgi:hypothetical protein